MGWRCGTFEGYNDHRRRGEPTCQPCRDANTARGKAYRSANGRPPGEADYVRAKYLATTRLINAHREEFVQYLHEEKLALRQEHSDTADR